VRELTFAGFLSRYVRELSLSGTNAISILAREAAEKNYRLREPLILFALFTDRIPLLRKSIRNDKLKRHAESILDRYDRERMLQALKEEDPELPPEYRKVWRSYLVRKNRKKAEAHTKELARQHILALQKEKGVSNYRIYKTLGLNPGNINDWLKNGTGEKVSLAVARKAFEFMQNTV
jgi:hypothetical protein